MKVELVSTFNFIGVPGRLIFHVIKIGRSAPAGKATAMANDRQINSSM